MLRKLQALNTLTHIESGSFQSSFWKAPWGEPEWVDIPTGEFWMGTAESETSDLIKKYGEGKVFYQDEAPQHKIYLPGFLMANTPITNVQYAIFIQNSRYKAPDHWRANQPPKGLESHPVVNVSWKDAQAYCLWLNEKTSKDIRLPSEAEWEKAARGPDQRPFPWGEWQELRCNSDELGLGETTPVDVFLQGASPYGCLDMSGNVWEWTNSLYQTYPYQAQDGRENLAVGSTRIIRGGAFYNYMMLMRCACRGNNLPYYHHNYLGFRVCVSRAP